MHINAVLKVLVDHQDELEAKLDDSAWDTLRGLLHPFQNAEENADDMIQAVEALADFCGGNDVLRPLLTPGVAGQPRIRSSQRKKKGYQESAERHIADKEERIALVNKLFHSDEPRNTEKGPNKKTA